MIRALALALLVAGCGGAKSNADRLIGKWAYASADGVTGEALNLNGDGTYESFVLQVTSASSGNAQEETGTYAATDGTAAMVPAQWSCPGPDPAATVTYTFAGADLVLADPSGELIMQPNTASVTSGYVITLGCFAGGAFTPSPLAPVSN